MKRRSAILALLCLLVVPDHVFAQGNGNGGQNSDTENNGNDHGNDDHGNGDNNGSRGRETGTESPSSAPQAAVELSESAALQSVESGRSVPLQSILPDVKARTGGEIINAQLQQVNGVLLYAIKVLTPDGKVMAEYYDAQSGRHVE